ncbi:MAG: glutaminyl-peptide cyclotransferase [Flavobacterium sp.]|nr:glutaminyl-peptide cyclotransferase [Pedobacter sp.]
MRFKLGFLGFVVSLICIHCSSENSNNAQVSENYWIKPEAGTSVNLGDPLALQLKLAVNNADSIIYYADSTRLLIKKDTSEAVIETKNLSLGNRLITARIYRKGKLEEINTNIILKSSLIPKKFSYQILKTFDHDTSSYTQGLEFDNGYFYESDGGNSPETGYSSLRRVQPATGKVVQKVDFAKTFFAEGLTVVDDKIVLLTWQAKIGVVFDKNSFKELSEFPYQNSPEGWGLCSDNKRLYKSDGTNLIYFLNRDSYQEEGYIEVYDQKGPVDSLNELEFIDGMIYANVYLTNRIVIINPKNGQVTGEIDMSDLLPAIYNYPGTDVLNGIAWDAKGKRLFVTGKRWAKLFEIQLKSKN